MKEITINKAQKMVDNWIKTYGVRYFSELTNMAILTEEVGEGARIISRKFGEQSEKSTDVFYIFNIYNIKIFTWKFYL